MHDLISRQAAIDKINERQRKLIYCFGFENDMVKIMDIAKSIITIMPSVQPEPRTAYWTKDIVGSVVCSYCGGIREDNRIGHTQWCNCCGCFMRGEEND